MTNLRKKAVWLSLIGFVLGIVVGVCIQLLTAPERLSFTDGERIIPTILYLTLSGLLGALGMGSAVIYDIDDWSILRCTATHFLICLGGFTVFYALLIVMKWGSLPPFGILAVILGAYIAVYFCIWLSQYLIYRYKVKKMNEKLREWKARRLK